jgi:hypothetical protein
MSKMDKEDLLIIIGMTVFFVVIGAWLWFWFSNCAWVPITQAPVICLAR